VGKGISRLDRLVQLTRGGTNSFLRNDLGNEGSRSDEALWKAKIKMKKSTFIPNKKSPDYKLSRSHPYFWAPFVLVEGNN
jgi:CHAT domain-containing protein